MSKQLPVPNEHIILSERTPPSTNVAGDGNIYAGVNGGAAAPGLADEVLQVEGDAAHAGGARAAIGTWLFQPQQPARPVALHMVPRFVREDKKFVRIDLSEYVEQDVHEVARLLHIHQHAVRLALAVWQRPRLDIFADHFVVTATVAHLDPHTYRVRASWGPGAVAC